MRSDFLDQTGKIYGLLTVVKMVREKNAKGRTHIKWFCKCECGGSALTTSWRLRKRSQKSCGCLAKLAHANNCKEARERRRIPYQYGKKLSILFSNMHRRCYNQKCDHFKYYGAKGIGVCSEWHIRSVFYKWASENGYALGLSIERKNGTKDYGPSNCYFADAITQQNNTSRNRYLEFEGEKLSMAQWSRKSGIKAPTIINRLNLGWTPFDALYKPTSPNGHVPKTSIPRGKDEAEL